MFLRGSVYPALRAKNVREQNLLQSEQKMWQKEQKMLQGEQKNFEDENCLKSE